MFDKVKYIFITLLLLALWFTHSTLAIADGPNENEQCLVCHRNPDLTVEFAEGEAISGYVSGTKYKDSVHDQEAMTCGGCHPNHQEYPHPDLAATNKRAYTLALNETCLDCHPHQAENVQDSIHARALAEGNVEAAVCVDCHGAHDTLSLHEARVEIAVACQQCHSTIYDEYYHSAHGKALREENNQDVPTCVDCHGVHTMESPHTTQFRLKSPQLCGSCHANQALMDKYGISTQVFQTYVADFHGTTVTLFEKQSPDAPINKAVCYDCHGAHAIRAVDDPEAAVIKQNLLKTCQKCHPDATANFPDSWTGHFPATFDKQPLVTVVNVFYYYFFIPGLIGFMVIFVATDAGRNLLSRGKHKKSADVPESEESGAAATDASDNADVSGGEQEGAA
jgi:nitrate/TMAO reductase-like tetraheme cytochrome c subunit